MLNKHNAHDIVHTFHGGMAENCPYCTGEMDDSEMKQHAKEIALANYKPKVDPTLSPDMMAKNPYMCDELNADDKKNILAKAKELGVDAAGNKKSASEKIFSTVIDIMKFAEDGKAPDRIKIFPIGKFNTRDMGTVEFTYDVLKDFEKHFNEGVRNDIPIDLEHGATQYKGAAAGWLKGVDVVKNDGMYAQVAWTELGKSKLESGEYKYISPEFYMNYIDPEHSFELDHVLTGAGLTNKPVLKELPALMCSEENLTEHNDDLMLYEELPKEIIKKEGTDMQLKDILAKAAAERTSDEQKFLSEHQDELTFAEAKAEGFVKAASEKTGMVSMSEDEVTTLKKMAAQGAQAAASLQFSELKDEVKQLTFSEKGAKIATDKIEVAAKLIMSMSEENKTVFKDFLKALPEKALFSEEGVEGTESTGQLEDAALAGIKKFQEENKGLSFAEATSQYMNLHPEAVDYQKERKVATPTSQLK